MSFRAFTHFQELVSRTRIHTKSRAKGSTESTDLSKFSWFLGLDNEKCHDTRDRSRFLWPSFSDRRCGWVSKKRRLIRRATHSLFIAEVVETLHAIQTKQLVAGSAARVADCCPQPVDELECVAKLGGICRATDYPKTTGQCLPNKCQPFARVRKLLSIDNPFAAFPTEF